MEHIRPMRNYKNYKGLVLLIPLALGMTVAQAAQSTTDKSTFAEAAKYTVKLKARTRYPFYDDEIGSLGL